MRITGQDKLTVRSYVNHYRSHAHPYHQMVLPLHGTIDIRMDEFEGPVGVGEAIVIPVNTEHAFKASLAARFVVADLTQLPNNLVNLTHPVIALSSAFYRFLQYVDVQLSLLSNQAIHDRMLALFYELLAQQTHSQKLDRRIQTVIDAIHLHPQHAFSLSTLASMASLSEGHLKKRFRKEVGMSVMQYVTKARMEKAQALLANTDTPVGVVAGMCGYEDASAFSRRFRQYFGHSPRR